MLTFPIYVSALHFLPFSQLSIKKFEIHFVDSLTKDLNEFYGDEHVRREYKVKGRFGLEGNKKIEIFVRKFFMNSNRISRNSGRIILNYEDSH